GNIVLDHVEPESGGYTGLCIQRDPITNRPAFYAATITGGLYVLRTVEGRERGEGHGWGRGQGREVGQSGLALRCVSFVQGNPIL
ncbi:unnamed protein product, partial [Laminaria digitata]